MEWQQIIGFYHVAKLKSFTRAAEATFRTQSALTQQIKSLEGELDCLLFERIGRRKIILTPMGERLFRFSELLLREYEQLINDIGEDKGLKKGRLKVAAPFTTLYHLLPAVVKKYNRAFPWVELSLFDRSQHEVIELVRGGDADIGFALEENIPAELAKLSWKTTEPVLLTSAGHPLTKTKKVSLEDIARWPLILPPKAGNSTHRHRLEELFRQYSLDYRIVMESSNVELSSLYVEMGLGVSFASVVKGLPIFRQRKLAYVSLGHLIPAGHICIVTTKNRVPRPFQEAFVKMLFAP